MKVASALLVLVALMVCAEARAQVIYEPPDPDFTTDGTDYTVELDDPFAFYNEDARRSDKEPRLVGYPITVVRDPRPYLVVTSGAAIHPVAGHLPYQVSLRLCPAGSQARRRTRGWWAGALSRGAVASRHASIIPPDRARSPRPPLRERGRCPDRLAWRP